MIPDCLGVHCPKYCLATCVVSSVQQSMSSVLCSVQPAALITDMGSFQGQKAACPLGSLLGLTRDGTNHGQKLMNKLNLIYFILDILLMLNISTFILD